ncbi:MAG: HNH endonuclease, partial [Haliea sp.]
QDLPGGRFLGRRGDAGWDLEATSDWLTGAARWRPMGAGGRDRWENVVAACRRCNWAKDNRTPEEANMPLLAVPFRPNTWEWHFLAKERVLADQMDYLSQQFRALRAWAH